MDPKLIFMSKAKPFTGANGQEWRRWLTRFEAQTVDWSAAERLQCLPALLEDGALDLYAALSAATQADYAQVIETRVRVMALRLVHYSHRRNWHARCRRRGRQ